MAKVQIRRRRTPAPAPSAPPAPPPGEAQLRSTEGLVIPLTLPGEAALGRLAYQWSYIVRNRQRHTAAALKHLHIRSRDALADMGVSDEQLQELAARCLVEVRIPFHAEDAGWALRILPWESLLSLATKPWRQERHLVVVRHLDSTGPAFRPRSPEAGLLFVASAPGKLAEHYDFTGEHVLVQAAFPRPVQRVDTPTREDLVSHVEADQPGIIHLSAIDTHQAETLAPGEKPVENRADGILLADLTGDRDAVGVSELPSLIVPDRAHPASFVAFNCHHSGARLAPLTVARGAAHALGFQDTIDDTVAEQFFAAFYPAWKAHAWGSPLRAFALARLSLGASLATRQSGDAVLWSSRSLIPADSGRSFHAWLKAAPATPPPAAPPTANPATPVGKKRGAIKAMPPAAAPAASAAASPSAPNRLSVQVKPRSCLNYSLLHNNAAIFEEFKIVNPDLGTTAVVEIHIELHVGETTLPYRGTLGIDQLHTDLSERIRVPLVASMLRGRRESIHTSLYIEVTHADVCVHRSTERVTLLPADEWTDSPADWKWLPSFVLPRDTAILAVLGHAERYLRALADDAHLGFDGYQRLADGSDTEVVDRQARAIWSALLHDPPLSYINPPPVYTRNSQRLRTPAVIFEERRGTCIDLALFFSACLEYVGIYPAVFLIKGHAFPAYWRDPRGLTRLREFCDAPLPPDPSGPSGPSGDQNEKFPTSATPPKAWVFEGAVAFDEIRQALVDGSLVPLETVELTRRGSFAQALELGLKNLLTPWNFDALVDIQTSRENGITPLPLFNHALSAS